MSDQYALLRMDIDEINSKLTSCLALLGYVYNLLVEQEKVTNVMALPVKTVCGVPIHEADKIINRITGQGTEVNSAADVVEVVRCKNCRWGREVCGNIECSVDRNLPEYHGYEWFCPNGESMDEVEQDEQ